MTMPPTHPDDERLSALAGGDPDAAGDAALRAHVSGCERCASTVDELARLRAVLATLPDVAPPRPLRLLPAVEAQPSGAERLAGVVRRLFAPVVAAGVGVALLGAVGTAGDVGLFGAPGAAAPAALEEAEPGAVQHLRGGGDATEGEEGVLSAETPAAGAQAPGATAGPDEAEAAGDAEAPEPARSPWPMVAFAGFALVVAAFLLRWILVPRGP